jgi:hypothetical protein
MLEAAAADVRWRMREATAMALQRIAEADFEMAKAVLDRWMARPTPVLERAIVAALAHPPILHESLRVAYCLQVSDRITMT